MVLQLIRLCKRFVTIKQFLFFLFLRRRAHSPSIGTLPRRAHLLIREMTPMHRYLQEIQFKWADVRLQFVVWLQLLLLKNCIVDLAITFYGFCVQFQPILLG